MRVHGEFVPAAFGTDELAGDLRNGKVGTKPLNQRSWRKCAVVIAANAPNKQAHPFFDKP